MTTTILGVFPQTAKVGQPFPVMTRNIGPVQTVQVWLEDGQTSAWRGATPAGVFKDAPVELVPQRAGSFRVFAKVLDANGCERDRTASARWVTVN